MGVNNRDHDREVCNSDRRTLFSRRNLPAIFLVVSVVATLALEVVSRYMFPDNWNAVARALDREEVGWAGIGWDGVPPEEQAALGVPFALKVTEVALNGPADKAGLMVGDYIVGLNSKTFADVIELQGNARSFRPGQTITLNLVRASSSLTLSIKLTTWAEIEGLDISGVGL